MISGLTVNIYIYKDLLQASVFTLAQAGVSARVLQRGLLDDQLGGRLVHLGHLGLIVKVLAVLLPRDVSLATGWREK